jgi:hypothetical protein
MANLRKFQEVVKDENATVYRWAGSLMEEIAVFE